MNNRNKAQLQTFPVNKQSLLVNNDLLNEYSLSDAEIRKKMMQSRKYIMDSILPAPELIPRTTIDQESVLVQYDPNRIGSEEIARTLHTDGIAEADRNGEWRFKTRHRDITSTVACFGNGFGDLYDEPFTMNLTTGCAINLMGSSVKDLNEFVKEGALINPNNYKDAMKLLFKRWLRSQDFYGVQVVILPLAGGGVYLNKLTEGENRDEAITQINLALKEAVEESVFNNILEIIFALPDRDGKRGVAYQKAVLDLAGFAGEKTVISVGNVDVFNAANVAIQNGYRPGLINPGSDRTIGGYYKKDLDLSDVNAKVTLEEMIFNLTNAASVHSIDFNPFLRTPIRYIPYPDNLKTLNEIDQCLANAMTIFNSEVFRLMDVKLKTELKISDPDHKAGIKRIKMYFSGLNKDVHNFVTKKMPTVFEVSSATTFKSPKAIQLDKEVDKLFIIVTPFELKRMAEKCDYIIDIEPLLKVTQPQQIEEIKFDFNLSF